MPTELIYDLKSIIQNIFSKNIKNEKKLRNSLSGAILCTVENLSIDEQDCGLDFFAPTDRR